MLLDRIELLARPMLRVLVATMIATSMLILAGCATPPPPPKPAAELVWPAPPEKARIRFVRNIVSEQDLKQDTTQTQSIVAFLTGEKIPEGRIAQPMALAVSDDCDRLYVADALQNLVFIFDFKNKKLSKIEVGFPGGIALDAQENLYVVETTKQTVAVFNRNGEQINEFTDKELERPLGLAIDRLNGKIYVVDTGSNKSTAAHNVKVFDMKGKRIGTIGKKGTRGGGDGEFSSPTFATVDNKGNLYVSDSLNSRVQKFDANGNFLTIYGQLGSGFGEFDKPKGLALDSFDNLYVVDTGFSNVQIFNQMGQILLFFGTRGPVPGMLKNPISLAIDKNNRIYVGDYLNHRIAVYQLINSAAEDVISNPASK